MLTRENFTVYRHGENPAAPLASLWVSNFRMRHDLVLGKMKSDHDVA
jgi:hypothetical protein